MMDVGWDWDELRKSLSRIQPEIFTFSLYTQFAIGLSLYDYRYNMYGSSILSSISYYTQ